MDASLGLNDKLFATHRYKPDMEKDLKISKRAIKAVFPAGVIPKGGKILPWSPCDNNLAIS